VDAKPEIANVEFVGDSGSCGLLGGDVIADGCDALERAPELLCSEAIASASTS